MFVLRAVVLFALLFLLWSNSVTNKAEATRIIGVWADGLVKGLDRVNGRASD